MKKISCENFALQKATLTGATDTIYKCLNTGKRYYWTGSAFAEYFEVAQGGNITITPLAQTLPKASVSDRKVIDTPYSVEPINNINLITGSYAMPTTGTYARAFVAPHTGRYGTAACIVGTTGGTNIVFGIYDQAGNLLGQASSFADSSSSNGWSSSSFWYDANRNMLSTAGVQLTGGKLYFFGVRTSSTGTLLLGYNNLPTFSNSKIPLQAFTSTVPADGISMPATLTLNGSNVAIFPYIRLDVLG